MVTPEVQPSPPVERDDERFDYDEDEPDRTCKFCDGTGGDPWNDGITPCEHCDGEGFRWWE